MQHDQAVQQAQQQAAAQSAAGQQVLPVAVPFVDPGIATRQAAQELLTRARDQLQGAGEAAARTIAAAGATAPQQPAGASGIGDFLASAGSALLNGAENLGADAINGAASLGNAALHHPEDVGLLLAAAAVTTLGGGGEVLGLGLDLTGARRSMRTTVWSRRLSEPGTVTRPTSTG